MKQEKKKIPPVFKMPKPPPTLKQCKQIDVEETLKHLESKILKRR